MSHELEVGQVLDERFHILDVISRSGMASIFKAKDMTTGQIVAVKVPFLQFESDPGFYSRFQREEEIGKGSTTPTSCTSCRSRTKKAVRTSSWSIWRPDAAAGVAERGSAARGRRVGHRRADLRGAGVSPPAEGHPSRPEAGKHHALRRRQHPHHGFRHCQGAGLRRLTFTGFTAAMGTPDYMAPEQVKGKRGDQRTDIYSLGAMLYEMVTGETPFEGDNPYAIMNARLIGDPVAPRKLNPEITPQVEEIILHALEQKPYDRYAERGGNAGGIGGAGARAAYGALRAAAAAKAVAKQLALGALLPAIAVGPRGDRRHLSADPESPVAGLSSSLRDGAPAQ